MVFALLVLLALAGAWLARVPARAPRTWSSTADVRPRAFGLVAVVFGQAPLALVAWPLSGLAPVTSGDARTHAVVAHSLAQHGAPHGWIDAYQAGFPLGVNYPPLGWLSAAALSAFGLPARTAVHLLGTLGVSLLPVVVYLVLLASRARTCTAVVVALFVAWQSPISSFYGGYEAYFSFGLLSQVLSVPFVVLTAFGVFQKRRSLLWAVLPCLAAVLAHPQVVIPALVSLGAGVLAAWDRQLIARFLSVAVAAAALAAALYGYGVATLAVPFGWPPLARWLQVGFGTSHLDLWFLEGEVLDYGRSVPVLTAVAGAGAVVVLITIRQASSRAALACALAVLGMAVSGRSFEAWGAVGRVLLGFFQPVRAFCLIPLAAAGLVLVALELALGVVDALLDRRRASLPRSTRITLASVTTALLVGWVASALPERFGWAETLRQQLMAVDPSSPCGKRTPHGYQSALTRQWLSALRGGRLWYDDTSASPWAACAVFDGFEIESAIPIAMSTGAGGHVGIHSVAFRAVAPHRAGSGRRANALGVTHVLFVREQPDGPRWEIIARSGDLGLARLLESSGTMGVGCVRERWRGSDAALRGRLLAELGTPDGADRLLDPADLVELGDGDDPVVVEHVPMAPCRADGARVTPIEREPGAHEAWVETEHPVDVVIKAAAFPTWRVTVDGQPATVRKVSPGFLSTRVTPGRHHVAATSSFPPFYLAGIVAALILSLLLAVHPASWGALVRRAASRSAS